ncbi:MAG: YdeI/OmpD-associated family protein [Flavobacteriales bacterium]|nr:YdeI/OmpD-associated family protein [Flavobacteriales bacterium]
MHNPKVDAYIEKSQEFARPILELVRQWVHEACPECTEVIKWGFPCFDYQGLMVSMASFKAHCAVTFWKGALLSAPDGVLEIGGNTAMGQFGKVKSIDDLPQKAVFIHLVHQAMDLNERNIKLPKKPKEDRAPIVIPEDFKALMKGVPESLARFEAFSYSHQKEYIEWIEEAKREATRVKRMNTAIEWLSEGKSRNWKYEKC